MNDNNMALAKFKCPYPECRASTKTKGELEEHWEEFHEYEDYPGPLKGGNGAKKAITSPTTPVAEQGEPTNKAETPENKDSVFKMSPLGNNAMSEPDLYNASPARGSLRKGSTTADGKTMSKNGATKRKATDTPKHAPPTKKKAPAPAARKAPAPQNYVKDITGAAPASAPASAPKPLGARAIARLTEKASNDPSRDLQPIRRPLPPPEQEWSDTEPVPGADESDEEEIIVPEPDIDVTTRRGYGDPFFNQDLSDSDMSTGISEDENGVPRFYDPHAPNPDPDHPYSTSAKYRIMPPRGIVKNPDGTTIDFDSCMTFPDAATLKQKLPQKVNGVEKNMAAPKFQVLMSFSENISTPEMNWKLRKSKAAASAQPNGEFLDRGLGQTTNGIATTGDSIMVDHLAKKAKERAVALKKKGKNALAPKKKKKKAMRLPKYQKRKYTWKDSTRKNKGKLYDSRKEEVEAEAEAEAEVEEGDDDE
ncbi:hypothetical protein BKA65DRAFT_584684 [Rhexocercosporidium sp. MPI-PUGE-AT-0058]|nr:hypothetical protein BKA65DRAFT_584684 [Rhexocercosporidium sp. MPI-PUGE-AT-0058]